MENSEERAAVNGQEPALEEEKTLEAVRRLLFVGGHAGS